MSKIALSGNASGTGTLTIAAPNTNSDRTLSLPDAAGEMYNQGNILGTVSQSGGVPTGAIIERGSNANGEFVKYADGTMICTSEAAAVSVNSISNASSGTLLSSVTFPATFAAAPVCQVLPAASSTGSDARASIVLFAGIAFTTLLTQIYAWNRNNYTGSVGPTFRVQTVAIGRWF